MGLFCFGLGFQEGRWVNNAQLEQDLNQRRIRDELNP